MKQLMLICAILATATLVKAQGPGHWDENTGRTMNAEASQGNKLSNIEMEMDGRVVTFSHVPVLAQEIRVVITNAQGDEVASKAITRLNNAMDLRDLHKDKMYFVSIRCNNKTQKAFTLHL